MTDTNITEEHRRAFSDLTSGDCRNFALFSCFCDGRPTAAIAAVTVHPPPTKTARRNTASARCSSASRRT